MTAKQGALDGIRVLDLSRMLPGPYCSMILADHGAEVIAIEDRKFQEDGLFFNDFNRNKQHMSLNLKTPAGLEIFFKLADQADVILEGFRPGVTERLGVDYAAVSKRNQRIIYCSISGYGQTGPLRNRVGHDVNYLSEAGVLDLVGEKDGRPIIPGVQIADIAGGSMNAVVGILMALFSREKSGKGQYIDIAMTDGVIGLLSLPYYFAMLSGKQQRASDMLFSHRFACYNTYQTKDGRSVAVGAVENRFWKNLCLHLKRPEYVALQYDEESRQEIIEDMRKIFLSKSMDDWQAELADLEVCFSVVKNLDEILVDPHFQAREMVHSYSGSDGKARQGFGIPVKLSETPGSVRSVPARFGENTGSILQQLGYTTQQIEDFYAEGVV